MNLRIFKYSLKVWGTSVICAIPIGAVLYQLNSMHHEPNLVSISIIYDLVEHLFVLVPFVFLPSSLVFTFFNINLNKVVTNEFYFKLIISSLCMVLFFLSAQYHNLNNLPTYGLNQFTCLAYIGIHIIGIWIFKFDPTEKRANDIELPDILDA